MDTQLVEKKPSTSDIPSVTAELYFLIAQLLDQGPCRNAAEALKRELESHGLLPKRIDWTGVHHHQTYQQVASLNSHVRSNHLLEICRRLGPLVEKEVPNNVRGVQSLLGAGRQSILRTKGDLIRKLNHERYVIRQNQQPRCIPLDLTVQLNTVPLLFGRELTGSIDKRCATPTKLFSRVQLFCRTLGHLSAVYCVLFDRTGQYIFTGADDLLVKIWSALTGRLLATLRGASAEIADLAVSNDNTLLAAGSCDKIVRVWCLRTTAPVAVLTGHGGTITSIHFCPADRNSVRYLASTSSDGSVSFWEYVSEVGKTPKFFPKPHKFNEKLRPGQSQMLCASFSPGGMFLATGCADHHVRVYAMFGQEGPERILELEAHSDRVDSIQWANSGLRFISGSKDGTALLWRYEHQEWRTIRLRMTSRLAGQASSERANAEDDADARNQKLKVTMVTWSLDDRWLVTAVSDFSLKLWDSSTGTLHKELIGHEGEAFVLEPHPHDANIFLSAGHDGRLLIWDLAKGEVIKSFLNFIEGQGHGAVFDAKWNPSGSTIAATDSHGHLSIYGIGPSERFKKLPKAVFFHTDYRPLIRDAHHHVLDEQTQLAPHLMPPPFLVDSDGNPYPPALQRLVPGREHLKDDQLVPTIVVNASGEPEILAGVQVPEAAAAAAAAAPAPVAAAGGSGIVSAPAQARSNIDQMIAELAHQQQRQLNRPRSASTSATTTSAASSVTNEHSYTTRALSNRALPPLSSAAPRDVATENGANGDGNESENAVNAMLSTETTSSESLPGFSRRAIVKPLTNGQLASLKSLRQGYEEEEMNAFYQEMQRKSPDILYDSSVSAAGNTAVIAARTPGVNDNGWSPSRPRRHPPRPRRERAAGSNVSSPARPRIATVSVAPRRTTTQTQHQSQHNYRTRANRTSSSNQRGARENRRERNRSDRTRRVFMAASSSDEGERDNDEEETESQNQTVEADEDLEVRQTRSNAARRHQRDGALSTSDTDDSDSELASDLLGSDSEGSETQGGSSSSSSEYSDWTAEAGVNLEPPKRTRRKVYRRPQCLSSEDEAAASSSAAAAVAATGAATAAASGASTSSAAANEGEEGEASNSPASSSKKKKVTIPKPGAGGLDRIPESFRPSEWLSEVIPRRTPFYPQMGDEIIYFRQGHELYVNAVKEKKLFELPPRSLPWSNQTIREQELVKVIGIKYEIKPPRLCCLKLGLMEVSTGALTGQSFTLKYHDMADVLDFLVLRQTYDLCVQRNWKAGDHFRCIIDDLWWEGQVEVQEPYHQDCANSMFLCYRIRWDNGECDRMSPWDLEPIDPERQSAMAGAGVTVLPEEIANTLYQPRTEDWPPGGDRDDECDRISVGISQVMSLAIAEPFAAPVDLNLYPSYAYVVEYPIDLSTIKARLDNRFYRRITAVQYDVRYIYTNACKFNEPKSTIVRYASIITDLCLEIIRNRELEDATALYHQLVDNYRASPDLGEASRSASTKRNGTINSQGHSSQSNSDSDVPEEKPKRNRSTDASSSKSKDKRLTSRIATAAALSWKQQCKDLVELLRQSEDAAPFLQPVNVLDVPDYLQVIDHPMDLQTVREELQVGNYETPVDFAKDVRLIFENSKNYNTNKKSRIYAMTVRLSAAFEEHIRGILASFRRKNIPATSSRTRDKSKDSRNKSKSKGKAWRQSSHVSKTSKETSKTSMNNGSDKYPRESLKIVFSRVNCDEPSTSSHASESVSVGSTRRRILDDEDEGEDDEDEGASSYVNGNASTAPGPSGFSPAELVNGLSTKRATKRRIYSSNDEDEDEVEEEESDEQMSVGGKSSDAELVKGKTLKKRESTAVASTANSSAAASVGRGGDTSDSDDEDETPISLRRRAPITKASVQFRFDSDRDTPRPTSSSSNSSNASKGQNSNSGSVGGVDSQTLRRSERRRRPPKRPLDSEPSENDEALTDFSPNTKSLRRQTRRQSVPTRNAGRRTVRYREDSEDAATANYDDNDNENDDPSLTKKRRRPSSEAKRMRLNISSDDEESDRPTYSVSSRGRVRKLNHHSGTV